jgi:hypothetical protein
MKGGKILHLVKLVGIYGQAMQTKGKPNLLYKLTPSEFNSIQIHTPKF